MVGAVAEHPDEVNGDDDLVMATSMMTTVATL